jgi:hypothetical protein
LFVVKSPFWYGGVPTSPRQSQSSQFHNLYPPHPIIFSINTSLNRTRSLVVLKKHEKEIRTFFYYSEFYSNFIKHAL